MRPIAPWLLIYFQGTCASHKRDSSGSLTLQLKIFVRAQAGNVEKGALQGVVLVSKGDVRVCDSQSFKTHVTAQQKVGMSKAAYHRRLVEGLEVAKRPKRWNTIEPSKWRPFNFIRRKCKEIVLSMCTVQCVSMEDNALSFICIRRVVTITSSQPGACLPM